MRFQLMNFHPLVWVLISFNSALRVFLYVHGARMVKYRKWRYINVKLTIFGCGCFGGIEYTLLLIENVAELCSYSHCKFDSLHRTLNKCKITPTWC